MAKNFKILVVDDDKEIFNIFTEALSDKSILLYASNGIEGRKLITENIIDLVICDIKMPLKDGHILLEELRRE